jgi:hypothetical protein
MTNTDSLPNAAIHARNRDVELRTSARGSATTTTTPGVSFTKL